MSPSTAHPQHAHGRARDALRDLSEEGEEQVVSAEAPRHSSRRPIEEVGREEDEEQVELRSRFETEKKRVDQEVDHDDDHATTVA